MKTISQKINGKLCTVIVREDPAYKWLDSDFVHTPHGYELHFGNKHFATAIFALPQQPQPEDMALLYRYMAEGLHPFAVAINKAGQPLGSWFGEGVVQAAVASRPMKITGAINIDTGERVDVAIVADVDVGG